MYKKVVLIMSLSVVFFSCSDQQSKKTEDLTQENYNEEKIVAAEATEVGDNVLATTPTLNNVDKEATELSNLTEDKKKKLAEFLKKRGTQSSITFNGEKFSLHSPSFSKGSKVYNMQMGEYGLVKGSIVVVNLKKESASELQYPSVEVKQIAKNTFRLIPAETIKLMPFYKKLITSKRFSVVEMEVDYSPIKVAPEY